MELANQTILITGAAGGLGSTAALTLARQGASIILLDKIIPRLEIIYDKIVEAGGPTPSIYPIDLEGANETQYLELADTIEEKFGSLQGLLHSAVDSGISGPIATLTSASWAQPININLNAPFILTRVLLPILQKSDHASIVFTSDSSVRDAKAYTGGYGASKIAMEGLAKILAEELESRKKVRVNILVPGPVDSPLRKRTFPGENKDQLVKMDSLSPVYSYLFGPDSIEITGQTIEAHTFQLTS